MNYLGEKKLFEGAITALVTPFVDGGEIDFEGFKKNLGHQFAGGVQGLVPLGSTGESPTICGDEKRQVFEFVINQAKGKAFVIAGVGTNNTKTTVENARLATDLGADGLLVVTPYYNKPTPSGLIKHFQAIASAVDTPIVVYNIKARTGINIATSTMKEISKIPSVAAVKEASGDINQMQEVIAQIPKMTVLSGDDGMTLPVMKIGGKGIISVVSNLVPKDVCALVQACEQKDFVKAQQINDKLAPLVNSMFIETNPIPVKQAMDWSGLFGGGYRLPLCEMTQENKAKLRQALENYGGLLK